MRTGYCCTSSRSSKRVVVTLLYVTSACWKACLKYITNVKFGRICKQTSLILKCNMFRIVSAVLKWIFIPSARIFLGAMIIRSEYRGAQTRKNYCCRTRALQMRDVLIVLVLDQFEAFPFRNIHTRTEGDHIISLWNSSTCFDLIFSTTMALCSNNVDCILFILRRSCELRRINMSLHILDQIAGCFRMRPKLQSEIFCFISFWRNS